MVNIKAQPFNKSAEIALAIYADALMAVHPSQLVPKHLIRSGNTITAGEFSLDLSTFDNVRIAGAGKASVEMARAVASILPDRLISGLVITKTGHGAPLDKFEIVESAHPVPDESSIAAGQKMLAFAASLTTHDLVIFCLSGGASSLMELPAPGVSLHQVQTATQRLLAQGVNIEELNAVRSRLSRIKAGGLARAFKHVTVLVLVLSDVIGDDLATIGSGPFVPGHRHISEKLGVWSGMRQITSQVPLPSPPMPPHVIIGSLKNALAAAWNSANQRGLRMAPPIPFFSGESREEANKLILAGKNGCVVTGGEPVVTLTGIGRGGRAQEFATAAAIGLKGQADVAILAGSTDGTDGPTEAAGGLVDGDSVARAAAHGVSAEACLRENNSNHFLSACQGLIVTGPTGTNVNDIYLLVR